MERSFLMDERSSVRTVQDTRRPAYGWGRILVGVFAVFGTIVLAPSLVSLVRNPDEAPAVWSFNLLGGGLYILLAVCVAHNGRRMRNIGWMCLGALATMAVLIGVLTLTETPPTPADLSVSVWAHWGRSRWYLPVILPIVAAAWMWMSDPRRIVANAERITELSDTLTESITEKARAVQESRGLKSPRSNEDGPGTGIATERGDSSGDDQ